MQTWTDVLTSTLNLIYSGTTTNTSYGTNDGENIVCFGPMGTTGTLAENTFWFYTSSGMMLDSDIKFNTSYPWATSGSAGAYDVENVGTHELGHSLSLKDLYDPLDSEKTMYGYSSTGETQKRSLHQDDIDGITYLYPDTTPPTGTITINSGASYTSDISVTLTLLCTDNSGSCAQMQFSNDNVTWSTPEAYAMLKSWDLLSGDGTKTVYVRYNDSSNNWSGSYSDTINLDMTNPTTSASPSGGTYSSEQNITLTCNDGVGSGCDEIYYTIDGTDPTKTVIVSSLYDSWWCQGTADSAIGMGIVLAIAKYFYEHQIMPKYTIKFIAFGGEEYDLKGAKYYEAIHKDENIIYMIDLNQLGFTQEKPRLTLDIVANKPSFLNEIWIVAERSNYIERTGNVTDIKKILWSSGTIPSNPTPFATNRRNCNTVSFFKNGGWILHHRDGLNHTEGDVLKYFNWTDVNVTGEIILNITRYLTVDLQHACSVDNYLSKWLQAYLIPPNIKIDEII